MIYEDEFTYRNIVFYVCSVMVSVGGLVALGLAHIWIRKNQDRQLARREQMLTEERQR